jgi:two-component system, NarL family, response regulator LiaR
MRPFILADNQDITKAGILNLLNSIKGIGEIHEAENKKELLSELVQRNDAVVILDFSNFDFLGLEDLQNVCYRFKNTHWLLFSDELSDDFLRQLRINYNRFSVVFKDSGLEEIRKALTFSLKNESFFCEQVTQQMNGKARMLMETQDKILTNTEKEVLRLIALGKTTKEIALERFSSIHTITTHRKNIFRKLEVNSVHEATKYALRSGIIDSAEYYI